MGAIKEKREIHPDKNRITLEMSRILIRMMDDKWKKEGFDSRNDMIRFIIRKYLIEIEDEGYY